MVRENKVKKALQKGKTVFGSMTVEFRSPSIAQIFATSGFDFMFIDTEHSPYGIETVADIIWASKAADICPIVRVTDLEYHLIARTFDLGAQGIMVPRRETAKQVQDIIKFAKYPPQGERGLSTSPGGHTNFESEDPAVFMERSNEETLIIIQIESQKAIENIEDMVSIPGVDVALIGPNDLSKSLGVVGQVEHPKVRTAVETVIEACKEHGVASGLHTGNISLLKEMIEKGMQFITWTTDARILVNSCTKALNQLKSRS